MILGTLSDTRAALEHMQRLRDAAATAITRREGQQHALEQQRENFATEAASAAREQEVYERACEILRTYADSRTEQVQNVVQDLVSQGLTTVFGEDLRLVLRSKQHGKRTDTDLRLVTEHDGVEVDTDILSARGGGVAAVTGFLLRVVMVLLTEAPRVLFCDETFAQVSAEFEPRLADFVGELADELGIQVILVTHSNAFEDVSDAVYRMHYDKGVSRLERVK